MARTIAICLLVALVSPIASAAPPAGSVRIEIDGVNHRFQQCEIRSETAVIELRDANGTVHSTPGPVKHVNVVCSRPLTSDKTFWQWHQDIEHGTVNRKTLVIVFLDARKREVTRFTLFKAWPAAARIVKGGREEIEIAHEGIQ